MVRLFIINGFPRSGKDTFVQLVQDEMLDMGIKVENFVSSDLYKKIAVAHLGWDGVKNAKGRKLIADLMACSREYNDGVFINSCKFIDQNIDKSIIFVHVREPEDIKKYVDKYSGKIKTIFMKRKVDQELSNSADRGVENYAYDIYINNDLDLRYLKELVHKFIKEFLHE